MLKFNNSPDKTILISCTSEIQQTLRDSSNMDLNLLDKETKFIEEILILVKSSMPAVDISRSSDEKLNSLWSNLSCQVEGCILQT